MADRLSAQDAAFLYAQRESQPSHVGGVVILEPLDESRRGESMEAAAAGGSAQRDAEAPTATEQADAATSDYERILAHISARLPLVPRYRQRVRAVPGRLARPVWIDDESFDITYHVRRSALPAPGTDAQLNDLVGRLISRPLDLDRPLWEIYVVEGLAGGRVAIINKTHEAMVDRLGAVDLAAAILDLSAKPRPSDAVDLWVPEPAPSDADLLVDAVSDLLARPSDVADVVRLAVLDLRSTAGRVARTVSGIAGIVQQTVSPAPRNMLGGAGAGSRRFGTYAAELNEFRAIRAAAAGPPCGAATDDADRRAGRTAGPAQRGDRHQTPSAGRAATIHDVMLTVLTGALRGWLLANGEPTTDGSGIRALVPMSVRAPGGVASVTSLLVDLPVGEPNPAVRLHQIAFQTEAFTTRVLGESGHQLGADTLAALGRYTPPTLHALGARLGAQLSRRSYNLLVTNVPGPQVPLYVAGSPVSAMYPVAPLVTGQALAVACTSYRGKVFYGLTTDRMAVPDTGEFTELLGDATDELAAAVGI